MLKEVPSNNNTTVSHNRSNEVSYNTNKSYKVNQLGKKLNYKINSIRLNLTTINKTLLYGCSIYFNIKQLLTFSARQIITPIKFIFISETKSCRKNIGFQCMGFLE
jgi:hypothetical protein